MGPRGEGLSPWGEHRKGGRVSEQRGLSPRPTAEGQKDPGAFERHRPSRGNPWAGGHLSESALNCVVSLPNSRPPGTSECDLIWQWGLSDIKLGRGHTGLGWALIQ